MRSDNSIATVTHRSLTLTHIMKSFIAILALVAVAAADVTNNEKDAVIVKQDADVFPDQYSYEFETSNGIIAAEQGVLENVGREDEGISVRGTNSHTAPNGERFTVTYIADGANGYRAEGAHLPTPWPIPEYIARSIAYNLANAKPEQILVQRP